MSKLKKYNLCLTPVERGMLEDLKKRGLITDFAEATRQAIRDYGTLHGLKVTDYQEIPA